MDRLENKKAYYINDITVFMHSKTFDCYLIEGAKRPENALKEGVN